MELKNSKSGMNKAIPKTKVLYLAYDGMTDPLGQSQVLSYLRELTKYGYSFDVISYEKPEVYDERKAFVASFIKDYDITWHPLIYSKNPPILSTVYDRMLGWKLIKKLYKTNDYKLVHCRGYILAGLAIKAKEKYNSKFLFDMRGWWPDEKKESGLWGSPIYKPVYNYFKREEKTFFEKSDRAISLTNIGKAHIVDAKLKEADKVSVIPTCVNFDVFPAFDAKVRTEIRKEMNIPQDALVLLYSGSVGANYRTDLVLKFFRKLKAKVENAYLVFLSHSDHAIIEDEISKAGVNKEDCRIKSVNYNEVGHHLMVGDIGIIMYNLGFSVIGRSPTKLGEYWASGLSCLSAKKIGDLQAIIEKYPTGGVLIDSLEDDKEFEKGVDEILKLKSDKDLLRQNALDYFSLDKGCKSYSVIYNKLLNE